MIYVQKFTKDLHVMFFIATLVHYMIRTGGEQLDMLAREWNDLYYLEDPNQPINSQLPHI